MLYRALFRKHISTDSRAAQITEAARRPEQDMQQVSALNFSDLHPMCLPCTVNLG
jgi:hypothetical protein